MPIRRRQTFPLMSLSIVLAACASVVDDRKEIAGDTPRAAQSGVALVGSRATSPTPFVLTTGLDFVGLAPVTRIYPSHIAFFLRLPVETTQDGLVLTRPDGSLNRIWTVEAYRREIANGAWAATTADMCAESFLRRASVTLALLSKARPPRRTFVTRSNVGLGDDPLLPAALLHGAWIGEEASSGEPVGDSSANGRARILEQTPTELRIEHEGWAVWVQEVARADFTGDGLEDILLYRGQRAIGGTASASVMVLARRTGANVPFSVESADPE